LARYPIQGTWKDGNGKRIESATVSVYLAGTSTAASVYTASSGGSPVNSVTTDSRGSWSFWVDDTDYTQDQLFKITASKTNYQSSTYDDLPAFPANRLVLDGANYFLVDGRTSVRTDTLGTVRHEHTAGIAGTRSLHLDVIPNGFDDTNCGAMRIDLENSSNNIRVKGLNFSANIAGATNSHINALEVAKVGDLGSGMVMDAVDVRPGVDVIDHHSGTIAAADTAFTYDDSGASYANVTTAFSSAGTDVSIFVEDDDMIYIGDAAKFNTIEVVLATVASNPGVKPTFEYSQGSSAWASLPVSDDTNGFRENGNIFYALPGDWATDTVNAVASKYWVRVKRTTNNLTTVPIEDTIKIAATTDYGWDADGDVTIKDITSSGTAYITGLEINDTSADHQYVLAVSELAADRTVTFPLLAGNDEFVFKDHAVTLTNKTLTTPTIGDLTNATHNHSNAAGGGTIAGMTRQVVNAQSGAVATGTTIIPSDDTVPQNTEGDEYMTLAITPKSATNKLKIDVVCSLFCSTGGDLAAALFQDSTANALAVGAVYKDANKKTAISFTHYMTTGTTSSTTFKVRGGNSAAGTTTFNGTAGARRYGGVLASSITITEIQV
jgi:hypothetical protein